MARGPRGVKTVQRTFTATPQASIDTKNQSRRAQAKRFQASGGSKDEPQADPVESALDSVQALTPEDRYNHTIDTLQGFLAAKGDICHLLGPGEVSSIGIKAVREWEIDLGSRADWLEMAEKGLRLAVQETENEEGGKDTPWEDASDINYPILTTAAMQWAARAYPELVRGDQVVGVKEFEKPAKVPASSIAQGAPPPQNPADARQAQTEMLQDQQDASFADLESQAKRARARRIKMYMNYYIFYKMDDWEGETDLLLHQLPVTGSGFKKVYWSDNMMQSEYVSPLRLTVHNDTKSIFKCPRITQDYDIYPYEVDAKRRSGDFQDISLPIMGEDPETPRVFIEQHRLEDLDGDGYPEPYIVTVDVETRQVMRIEPAYSADDVVLDEIEKKIIRIDRWTPFPAFQFIPDVRGHFYAMGFAKLLESITDSVDTAINQLMDAGTAEIAGGGFIGSNLRLTGSGQGGSVWFRPGEYQTVSTPGADVRAAIWERTTPHPSAVTLQLLELLLAAAKDIASVKDVITGDTPATAPVGTTMALQEQALVVFSAIYKRVYRGFRAEFRLMYECLKRWGRDQDKQEYMELTGGNWDEDFAGDATVIQPVADPQVVSKVARVSRFGATSQFAESPIGQAAGMTQPKQAQELAKEFLDMMGYDRPERFIGEVQPNPIEVEQAQAKTADMQAAAILKTAEAKLKGADVTLAQAKTVREAALAANESHALHLDALRVAQEGVTPQPEGQGSPNGQPTPQPAQPPGQ